jgi:hypothetical protein
MVKIVNYQKRQTEDGRDFFVLEVQGGIEMIKSQQTQQFYVTARKATISSTFDEVTCKALIGSDIPGKIDKVSCIPYEYTVKDTGEVITLSHRFQYVDEAYQAPAVEKSKVSIDDFMENLPVGNSFSTNGALKH